MVKIAIGQFMQESHSFTTIPCSWEQFKSGYIHRGMDVIAQMQGKQAELAGGIDVAGQHEIDIVPLLACNAVSSGHIVQHVFESLLNEMLDRLQENMLVDGVFLALHGAMVTEGDDDASGRILEAVRVIVGQDTPIAATLDLHANVTSKMVEHSDILVGYHTCPHVDMYETGAKCMELLIGLIAGQIKSTMALCQLPMILPAEKSVTIEGPFRKIMSRAIGLEQQPEMLSASVFYVQPWLDLPDVGCSVVVITDDNQPLAEEVATELADHFWKQRSDFDVQLTPLDAAVNQAINAIEGPIILANGADAPSGGASGDCTAILQALLDEDVEVETLINIVDPNAVETSIQSGIGTEVTLSVGGWSTALCSPVQITGIVRLISDGLLRFQDVGYRGVEFHRGRTVVLQAGSLYLQIMEQPVYQWDTALYRSVGLDPQDAQIVVVKSPAGFRAAYEPFAARIIHVDTPGLTSSNLKTFPWKHLSRPIYPLDDMSDWR